MFSALAMISGTIINTFETCVSWDAFPTLHAAVLKATRAAIRAETGRDGEVTCRFTHIYKDGPAPYYTVVVPECNPGFGLADAKAEATRRMEQWKTIKRRAMEAVIANGGTSTHHHAVGRLHREYFEQEQGEMYSATLRAIKSVHDPNQIMNPGVLVAHSKGKSKL